MYFFLKSGKTSLVKWAQCPHVIEPYSTTVTFASAGPTVISGRSVAFISSATGTSAGPVARCARLGSCGEDSKSRDGGRGCKAEQRGAARPGKAYKYISEIEQGLGSFRGASAG